MSDRIEFDVEAALEELAADAVAAAPRPGADLVARVLADAASVTAAAISPVAEPARVRTAGFGLRDLLFGWAAGAAAAAALALVVGIGVGMRMESELPMMAGDDEPVVEFFSAESGLLPDDFL